MLLKWLGRREGKKERRKERRKEVKGKEGREKEGRRCRREEVLSPRFWGVGGIPLGGGTVGP